MIFLDLETTGFNPKEDKIIEFAAVKVNETFEVIDTLDFLANPEIEIPEIVQCVTNIKDNQVNQTKPFIQSIQAVKKFIGNNIIVGHNIAFDISFLNEYDLALENKSIDTNDLATIAFPNEKSYALEVLSDTLDIEHQYKHRALGDVLACLDLLKLSIQEIKKFPESFWINLENLDSQSELLKFVKAQNV